MECPICGNNREFLEFNGRDGERCSQCASLARHRLIYLYLDYNGFYRLQGKKMLHTSPCNALKNRLWDDSMKHDFEYMPAGIEQVNLMDIAYKSWFSIIISSHVLEHVSDYMLALNNLYEALAEGGELLLQIPAHYKKTKKIQPVKENHFHEWEFSSDIMKEIQSIGFRFVGIYDGGIFDHEEKQERYGLRNNRMFVCIK